MQGKESIQTKSTSLYQGVFAGSLISDSNKWQRARKGFSILFYWTTQTENWLPELVSIVHLEDYPPLFFCICICICVCHLHRNAKVLLIVFYCTTQTGNSLAVGFVPFCFVGPYRRCTMCQTLELCKLLHHNNENENGHNHHHDHNESETVSWCPAVWCSISILYFCCIVRAALRSLALVVVIVTITIINYDDGLA